VSEYTTVTKVRLALARDLEKVQGTAASLSDESLLAAIVEASDRINSKLAGLYNVPFEEPIPALVGTIATNLAAYYAYLTFREVRDLNSQFDPVYLRYKEADNDLLSLQQGKSKLPEVPGENEGTDGQALDPINPTSYPLITACDFDLARPLLWWP
jgi:phage gp36-like protein